MREIVILSGKGGTGKTSIVGSLAALAKNKIMADCDVDAADLHLLLRPEVREKHYFWSGQTAEIDETRCTQCGLCEGKCRFDAIHDYRVDAAGCEGCGFCSYICPVEAVNMRDSLAGQWFFSDTEYGPLVHARLGIARENSGKLVACVRQQARERAQEAGYDFIISDGPPGTGCPVISSLSGADLALLVTEPTLSGRHDLERVIGVCRHFGVPAAICLNKYDINEDNAGSIEKYCREQGVSLAAKIPYDNSVTEAMMRGLPVVRYGQNEVSRQLEMLWSKLRQILES